MILPAKLHHAMGHDPLSDPSWTGIHVAFSNNNQRYPVFRRLSFITDTHRCKARVQRDIEPISLELDGILQ